MRGKFPFLAATKGAKKWARADRRGFGNPPVLYRCRISGEWLLFGRVFDLGGMLEQRAAFAADAAL